MIVAVIPARGGSKRIPNKNIREFCGKPIIAYSIEAALRTALFDRVLVSTDSDEIASVAESFGAECPFRRPPELAGDWVGMLPVLSHTVDWLSGRGEHVTHLCFVMATAPMVQSAWIRDGFDKMVQAGALGSLAVAEFPYPIQRALHIGDTGRLEMMWPEHRDTRSQELSTAYHDAGQFGWFDVAKWPRSESGFLGGRVPVMLPRHAVCDIDTPEDWIEAEQRFRVIQQGV